MAKTYITRRELEAGRAELRTEIAELAGRLNAIDQSGTRGVSALSIQLTTVIKDMTDMQADVKDFRREHLKLHEEEEASRTTRARWLISTLIAGFAVIEGPLIYLLAHLH
jgi:hypothetical protein